MHITYKYRIKDKHSPRLNKMARSVNYVWNYCNDAQKHSLKWGKKWPSGYDMDAMTAGSSIILGIHSCVISAVAKQYAKSRHQQRRPYLRYRGEKSLGWIPFRGREFYSCERGFRFMRQTYDVWLSRPLPDGARIADGSSFSQDSRGRWYLNIVLEIQAQQQANTKSVGIDLGLKELATLSTGETIEAPRLYRRLEGKLAKANRARKKRLAANINAKIANQRRDYLHKASTRLADRFGHIVVGNVEPSKLAKTKMAKSIYDAGWSNFREMLRYKAIGRGGMYEEVDEANTTRTCSDCGSVSGPQGRKGLGIREWECADCGAVHDRDHNAAILILRRRHPTPVEGAAA